MKHLLNERGFLAVVLLLLAITLAADAIARFTRTSPEVVVYLDKDAKQPAMLPLPETQVVAGERAALWWSVFNKALDKSGYASTARETADAAVLTVYGRAK